MNKFKTDDVVVYIGTQYSNLRGRPLAVEYITGDLVAVKHGGVTYTLHKQYFDYYQIMSSTGLTAFAEAKHYPDAEHTLLGPDGLYYKPDFDPEPPKSLCECGQEKAQPGSPSWMHSDWCKMYRVLT